MISGVDCNENSREVTREVWDEEAEEAEDRFCPLLARDNSAVVTYSEVHLLR